MIEDAGNIKHDLLDFDPLDQGHMPYGKKENQRRPSRNIPLIQKPETINETNEELIESAKHPSRITNNYKTL